MTPWTSEQKNPECEKLHTTMIHSFFLTNKWQRRNKRRERGPTG